MLRSSGGASSGSAVAVQAGDPEDDFPEPSWKLFRPKLLLDDLYGWGYRVLADGARRELRREGSNVFGGGTRAEL